MLRFLDIFFATIGLILSIPFFLLLTLISWVNKVSPLFYQQRMGKKLKPFILVKFRSMRPNTPSVATHLSDGSAVLPFGSFLRKSKIDELPQLWNVLRGDMSLVGPRPCLLNQKRLVSERKKRGVFRIRPGITGLAQVTGVTMASPKLLAKTDLKMIKQMNLFYYFYYILMTLLLIFKKRS
jgi:hypothetical protein